MVRKAAFFLFFFIAILSFTGCTGTLENLGQSSTVSAVNVSCSPTGVQPGQTSQCSAAVSGTGSFSQTVAWSAVYGTISGSGIYTAPSSMPSSGSDTITATSTQDSSKYKKVIVSINPSGIQPAVTKVSVTAAPASITTVQTAACTAAVAGTGSYSNAVSWTATGGTISETGMFTPSGAGTATCTANSAQAGYTNISGSASITVTAPPSSAPATVTSISVVAVPSAITTGQTSTCVATVAGTGSFTNAVTWTATGGTITQNGVFTPSGTGTASCVAHSAQSGYTNMWGAANVVVSSPSSSSTVTGITVSASPASINTAQTSTCSATVAGTGAFSNAVTWTATGGTITSSGVFTPSGAGSASCTAHSAQAGYNNISGSANIGVTSSPSTVTGISVVAVPASINTSQTSTCTATVNGTGAFSKAVTWTATDGTITSAGVFTPSATGTGTCVAHSAQAGYTNITGVASIAVASAPFTITSISVLAVPASITTAQTTTCAATVSGTGAFSNAVTWSATGGSINSSGVFTPSGSGNGACTATSSVLGFLNVSGTASIAVTTAPPAVSGVSLTCTPSSITTAQAATCTPTVTGTGAFTNTVNLSISPTAGGSLSSSTSVASGTAVTFTPASTGAETATITATSTQDSTKTAMAVIAVTVPGAASSCGGMSLGNLASLNGFVPFTSNSLWNTNIAAASLDPNSASIVAGTDFAGEHLHHDWSSVAGGDYGIPYVVVDSSTTPVVPINVVAYADESDVAYAPFTSTTPIEGAPGNCVGGPNNYIDDQHVLLLDRNRCMLYETFNTTLCNGAWSSDSETIWDMQNVEQRPWGWTSADAAGLSVFAGLVRYDEVASGVINHALRFTMQNTRNDNNGGYFVEPASHAAGTASGSLNVMGMRIRLKASFDISGYSAANQVILTAMKNYGMILADNGSNFFFQGTPDSRWNDDDLSNLDSIASSNFEVVQMTPAWPGWDENTAPTGAAPTINSFTASASTVAVGTPVTLTWSTTNDSYDFIDKLGGVHGGTVTFTPTAAGTVTYTLTATNQYGPSKKSLTIVVQ